MQADVEQVSPTEVKIRVEIPWERVEKGLDDSFRAMGKRARVKGFRPGKVPAKVLRRMFGQQVRGEVAADLIQKSLIEAVTSHEIPVVSQPELEPPELLDGKPLAFVAKMQVRPSIEPVDLSGISVERESAEVPDSAVQESLERLRLEHAELKTVEEERGAKEGDIVTVDYTVALDGEAKPEMASEGRTVELGNDSLQGVFEKGLLGATNGETRSIDLPFDADDERGELAGKTATFEVVVKSIQERILPEPDDEFAKDVGDYATLLELRLDLRKRLEDEAGKRAEEAERERLLDRLLEVNEVPVPQAMIDEEKHDMLGTLARIAQGTGLGAEALASMTGDLDERATRKVQVGLLLGAIAKEAKIEVGQEEVDTKLQELAEASGKHIGKVRADHAGDRGAALRGQLLEERLFAHLREAVTWTEAKASSDTADAESSKKKAGKETSGEKPRKAASPKKAKKKE